MAITRRQKLASFLAALMTGCVGASLLAPAPALAGNITVEVTIPYFGGSEFLFPGLKGAQVTCIKGCLEQPTEVTDKNGQVSFEGDKATITVRLENRRYITREQRVADGDRILLGHKWPREAAKSLETLRLPKGLILSWGLASGEVGGNFGCSYNTGSVAVVTVGKNSRRKMLSTMEHELLHAHQYAIDSGPARPDKCNLKPWVNSKEGQAWAVAMEADLDAGRVSVLDESSHTDRLTENVAEFWAWWRRAENIDSRTLCRATSRCALMEEWFGPRPGSYP